MITQWYDDMIIMIINKKNSFYKKSLYKKPKEIQKRKTR